MKISPGYRSPVDAYGRALNVLVTTLLEKSLVVETDTVWIAPAIKGLSLLTVVSNTRVSDCPAPAALVSLEGYAVDPLSLTVLT